MIELAADPRQIRDIQNFQTEVRQVLKIIRRRIEDEELLAMMRVRIVFVRRRLSAGLERKKPYNKKLQLTRETPACRRTQ